MDKKALLGSKILAVLMGLRGLMGLIAAITLPTVGDVFYRYYKISIQNLFIGNILPIVYLVGAVLVFKVNKYGWWTLIVLAIVETIKPVSLLFYGGIFIQRIYIGRIYISTAIIEFVIVGLIFWYLLRSKTREAFGIKLFSKT